LLVRERLRGRQRSYLLPSLVEMGADPVIERSYVPCQRLHAMRKLYLRVNQRGESTFRSVKPITVSAGELDDHVLGLRHLTEGFFNPLLPHLVFHLSGELFIYGVAPSIVVVISLFLDSEILNERLMRRGDFFDNLIELRLPGPQFHLLLGKPGLVSDYYFYGSLNFFGGHFADPA